MSLLVNTSALLTLALMALLHSGSAVPEKVTSCCTSASTDMIDEPILNVTYQKKSPNCVTAFVFETEKQKYCIYPGAQWVRLAILKLQNERTKAKAAVPSLARRTTPSLLSILTSTIQPSSSSLSPSSSSLSPSSSSPSPSSSPVTSTDLSGATPFLFSSSSVTDKPSD